MEPGVGPIKRISSTVDVFNVNSIDLNGFQSIFFSFIEHQVSLENSLFQIMTEPVEFKMLNIDKNSKLVVPQDP